MPLWDHTAIDYYTNLPHVGIRKNQIGKENFALELFSWHQSVT